ncbi:cation:proton antiporter [Rariglobus hedericola]|uniref:Sodium:proton exchanger n=1 Tax=Rariglobus hedericola TaxID=2597822 RepID=A0A556QQK8_9BACT|nr:cation:proton antiporter [Rariglobus hedericola]TSJ78909.1 sodium:proton exchanger [Rariglobus hedericola]
MHDISLITTIAFGLTAALVFGLLAKRIGLSPIVGYLLGGLMVGPHTPGFVGNAALASQLAEIGVILLMFGVGLHFHLKDLLAVRKIAVPGALGQSAAATVCCLGVAIAAGFDWKSGLVLGAATSVASTVVLLRVLMDHGLVDTPEGHVAIGWLVVEDIITVLVLVMLPALAASGAVDAAVAEGSSIWAALGIAVLKLVLLGGVVALAGAKFVPWLLLRVTRLRSPELFTLTVLVMAMAVAVLSYLIFDASMALGAFLAGMMVGQSKVSHQAGADALPMRDAFAVLFFVSVGMFFDYSILWKAPGLVLGVFAIIVVVKPVVALLIVIVSGRSLRTGLTVAGGLAQIGEFSFILAELAKSLKLMPGEGHDVLVAGAIFSISINPALFKGLLALEPWVQKHPRLASLVNRGSEARGLGVNAAMSDTAPSDSAVKAIVIGYGPVGQTLTRLLGEFKIDPTIIETNIDTVLELQGAGRRALYGDATRGALLQEAGIKSASYLVVTLPKTDVAIAVITAARALNPHIRVLTRARYLREREALEDAGAMVISYDEAESAVGLAEVLLTEVQAPQARIEAEVVRIRRELAVAH